MHLSAPVATVAVVALAAVGTTTANAQDVRSTVLGVGDPDRIAGQYVVVLEDAAHVDTALSRAQDAYGASVDNVYKSSIKGYSARMTPGEAEVLARAPGVSSVRVDTRVETAAQRMPTGVNRANADTSPTAAINRVDRRVAVDVAVIDTGVDLGHPDLNVYRRGAKDCATWSVGADDENGHGTHVAGTIGALDNRVGVVGMAPGARIWPIRVLDAAGSGTLSDVICGIDYVTRHAAQIGVANMSLSSSGGRDDGDCGHSYGDPLHQAVCASVEAGVTYAVAAGNRAQDASLSTPSAYDEVITVSALADYNGRPGGGARATCYRDVDDTLAAFSNHGGDVDLTAPGVCIRSTWLDGRYRTISGTSMASPHVAGGAALYLAKHPAASPASVQSALEAAGSHRWNGSGDPDGTHEPLLDVSGF